MALYQSISIDPLHVMASYMEIIINYSPYLRIRLQKKTIKHEQKQEKTVWIAYNGNRTFTGLHHPRHHSMPQFENNSFA